MPLPSFIGTPQFRFEESSVTGTITITEASIGTIGATDLVCALWYSTDVQLTPPSNLPLKFSWTDANGGRWGYYERVGSGGAQYVFTEQFTHAHSVVMWAASGVDTATGFLPNTPPTNSYTTGGDSTFVAPSVTTDAPNSLRLAIFEFINHNAVATPPSGMTALGISATTPGVGDCIAIFYTVQASVGASGTASAGLGSGDLGAAFQMYASPVGPAITTQPDSVASIEGGSATFTAAATGATSVKVQQNTGSGWTDIAGATSTTYTKTGLTLSDSGLQIRFAFRDGTNTSYSNAATLQVGAASARLYPVLGGNPIGSFGWRGRAGAASPIRTAGCGAVSVHASDARLRAYAG